MLYLSADEAEKDIVNKARMLVDSCDTQLQMLLPMYAQQFVCNVLDYCHREDFPAALTFTAAQMIAKWCRNTSSGSAGDVAAPLKSIKQNDTEFQFAVSEVSAVGTATQADFDSIKPQLHIYRKVRWPE
ncbi:hypothetical protein [uncultured Megasphaera sp.]|uniref:hypothetical protein n=1 Tax=uncultured Megasphaera sp. TaxID=165188 RepID=UPI00265847A9|nr:hypothetical protein [uncultured Megasphaera sp.]